MSGGSRRPSLLCAAFEATNRDFRVVVAADAVDSMDGEDMHRFALRLIAAALGFLTVSALWRLVQQMM